jgi:hypothetical protein
LRLSARCATRSRIAQAVPPDAHRARLIVAFCESGSQMSQIGNLKIDKTHEARIEEF